MVSACDLSFQSMCHLTLRVGSKQFRMDVRVKKVAGPCPSGGPCRRPAAPPHSPPVTPRDLPPWHLPQESHRPGLAALALGVGRGPRWPLSLVFSEARVQQNAPVRKLGTGPSEHLRVGV